MRKQLQIETEALDKTQPVETLGAEHVEAILETAGVTVQATPLVTALDLAKAKAKYNPRPLTTALITELCRTTGGAKRNWPGQFIEGSGPLPQTGPETVSAIVFDSGKTLCSPDELAQLQDLQARFEATVKTAEKFSLSRTSDYVFAARDEMQARVRAGEDVTDITMPTRETVFHNLLARSKALQALLLKMTQEETLPLCRPILERFEECLDKWLCLQEDNDRLACAAFHLEFKPGYLWRAGAVIAINYDAARKLPAPHVTASPRQVLAGLVDI